ncbi:MAG: hypothetical protein HRU70_04090 [Phycisphaeraceae bacterium]|nr:MAG: hypothetical protein HRU70_04090 [Phycisphaeraceae bacterium]
MLPRPDHPRSHGDPSPRPTFDPAWLFLIAGLALLASLIVLPAIDELTHARWLRQRALIIEQHRVERLKRHRDFLDALAANDPNLLLSLAGTQLNQIPADRTPLPGLPEPPSGSANVFPSLEPDPLPLPSLSTPNSMLHRLATDPTSRLWMLAIGSVLLLIGLLPASRPPQTGADASADPRA